MKAKQENMIKKSGRGKAGANGGQKVTFQVEAPAGSKVFVAGSFNNWDTSANRMRRARNGVYAAAIMLPPGRHEYKYVVDGEWQIDSKNPLKAWNYAGSLNSVITVPEKAHGSVPAPMEIREYGFGAMEAAQCGAM